MKNCTWENCQNKGGAGDGFELQLDKKGKEWSYLCPEHIKELNKDLKSGAKGMLRGWISANGGPKRLATKM